MLGLEYILFTKEISNNEVAEALDITPSAVSHIVKGRRTITQHHEDLLVELTGIPAVYFTKRITGRDKIEIELLLGAELPNSETDLVKEFATLKSNHAFLLSRFNSVLDEHQKKKEKLIFYIENKM